MAPPPPARLVYSRQHPAPTTSTAPVAIGAASPAVTPVAADPVSPVHLPAGAVPFIPVANQHAMQTRRKAGFRQPVDRLVL
jgi:hypothetical protein